MFLFYTLMCRNYQEYKWKPCWSQIGTFQKFVPELFSKMVTLRVEDYVKRKTLQLQSCRKFMANVLDIKFTWFRVQTAELGPNYCGPRWEDGNPRDYKGRNPSLWETPPPMNLQPPEPHFCLPHGSHLHGGGLPWSHEGRGLRGGAPPWYRRRGSPARRRPRGRRRRRSCPVAPHLLLKVELLCKCAIPWINR
jgi:hypothetical protein